ncbi:uncharacterized protein [Temnothorax longispinosus]|uniref:uncharacterized protein n=1 Tax=Temnothorax longispinosus TaxID=300112 RepID=UPI003A99C94F
MDSQIKFASVRYFDDESKKNCRLLLSLFYLANEEDLKHNKRRYVFKKLGYSDAVQIILDKENPEPNKTQKETKQFPSPATFFDFDCLTVRTLCLDMAGDVLISPFVLERIRIEFNNERTSEENDENIINEKLKTTNRDAKIFKRNQNKFSKIPSAVDRTSKIDDVDIIKNKLETLNRDSIAFEKTCEKLFEIPIAVEQEIQYLKDENNKLQLENNNLKTDIFLLKEELHTLKTKKQLFPKELKRAASPAITSTPKKMRSKTTVNAPLQDTICSEPGTSQLIHEQSSLQEDDLCMQILTENKTHKANDPKAKSKKKTKEKSKEN